MTSTSSINYWKYAVIIAVAIAIFWGGCQYGQNKVLKTVGRDTVITVTKIDTLYKPGINSVTNNTTHETKWYAVHDTLENFEVRIDPVDTARILQDYYLTRFYRDSQNLKRGHVIISDSVTQNRIVSRRLQSFNTDTTINNTIVLKPPRNFVLSANLSLLGNYTHALFGQGAGLSLKMPDDVSVGVNVWAIHGERPMYSTTVGLPIRLKIK